MKLAVIGDELSQDATLVAQTAVQLGFAGVEIRSLADTPPHQLTDDQLIQVGELLRQHGLAVAGFAPPVFKCPLPRTSRELADTATLLADSCRRAALLGAPHVRVFSFLPDGRPDPALAAKTTATLLSAVDLTVPLAIETGSRSNTPTVRHAMTYLNRLGRDDVGLLWDPANSVYGGWDPTPFPGDYLLGREAIMHVHVKDPDGSRGYVRLGDGDLDWPAIFGRLEADGYAGFLSLETHWREGWLLDEAARSQPWGEAFSRGGYAPSVECMQRMRRWADESATAST